MRDFKKRAEFLREQLMVLQSELKIQEKKFKELRGQYLEI
jgi:chaperonin cofactor prefoldin